MFKSTLALIGLSLSVSVNATIISLNSSFGADTITRDTVTGLDWLDVTETRGLSYNDVTAQMGVGGVYEGWRYATAAEFDQLVIHFGYSAVNTNCASGYLHCDTAVPGDNLIVEIMINTLGDTQDDYYDNYGVNGATGDASASGAARTLGMIYNPLRPAADQKMDVAIISDMELVYRYDGITFYSEWDDAVETIGGVLDISTPNETMGSFLVRTSAVPVPAAAWLFGSALIALAGVARSRKVFSVLD